MCERERVCQREGVCVRERVSAGGVYPPSDKAGTRTLCVWGGWVGVCLSPSSSLGRAEEGWRVLGLD